MAGKREKAAPPGLPEGRFKFQFSGHISQGTGEWLKKKHPANIIHSLPFQPFPRPPADIEHLDKLKFALKIPSVCAMINLTDRLRGIESEKSISKTDKSDIGRSSGGFAAAVGGKQRICR